MVNLDESALICDFAETYHIFDWRSLPSVALAATLAAGLGDDSRIMMKLRGEKVSREVLLLASLNDRIGVLLAGLAGEKNPPPSIVDALYGEVHAPVDKGVRTFASAEEFEKERKRLLGGLNG